MLLLADIAGLMIKAFLPQMMLTLQSTLDHVAVIVLSQLISMEENFAPRISFNRIIETIVTLVELATDLFVTETCTYKMPSIKMPLMAVLIRVDMFKRHM